MVKTHQGKVILLMTLAILSLTTLCVAPFIGLETIRPTMLFQGASNIDNIFWNLRVPRILGAWLIGAMLAISGMVFQAILRNPLAEPFTLGIASGGALGAALYIHLGLSFTLPFFSGVSVMAFFGAATITLLIYSVSYKTLQSTTKLLLTGVILSFLCSSIIQILQVTGKSQNSYRLMQWMVGSITNVGYSEILSLFIVIFISVSIIALLTPKLNLLNAGYNIAITRGVQPEYILMTLFLLVSIMMGVMIAVSGPIGFIGLIIPHMMRKTIGNDHRYLWIGVLFTGGMLLVVADIIAKLLFAPSELPVGVITALLGAPFFIVILLNDKKN